MSAITTTSDVLDEALRQAGLEDAFDDRGQAFEACPGCGAHNGLKLSLARGQVHCAACGTQGPLLAYLREKVEAGEWNHEPFSEAEIIPIQPRLPRPDLELVPEREPAIPAQADPTPLIAELVDDGDRATDNASGTKRSEASGVTGERIIISLLARVFLGAGLAAAALSGWQRTWPGAGLGLERRDCGDLFVWRVHLFLVAPVGAPPGGGVAGAGLRARRRGDQHCRHDALYGE